MFLGLVAIIGFWLYGVYDTFRKPTPEEFVITVAKRLKSETNLKLGTKAKDIHWKTIYKPYMWVDENAYPGVHSGVDCNNPRTLCTLYVRGDILAYAPDQVLESKDEYLNFTLIPSSDSKHPISLLLFEDGRIRTGKDYALGKPGKNGIAVIKTVPAYLENWQLKD